MKNSFWKSLAEAHWRAPIRAWQESMRWPFMLAVSGCVLLALLVSAVGVYTFVAAAEQRSWVARQKENTLQAGALVQALIHEKNNQLVLLSLLQKNQPRDAAALQTILEKDLAWLEMVETDQQGAIIASAFKDLPILRDTLSHRPADWFEQARGGSRYIGTGSKAADGSLYWFIAVPSSDGGVIAGRFSMEELSETLARAYFGETGIAYLLNRQDGRILAFPDPRVVTANTFASSPQVFGAIQAQTREEWIGSFENPLGTRVHAYARPIPETGWVVVTEIEQSETTQTRGLVLLIAAVGLLLGALIVLTLNACLERLFLRRIDLLNAGARQINSGSFQQPIPIDRPDALGSLAGQINLLASGLDRREQMLAKAQEKALLDSHFKSDLLARISHDLRQPLGVILGFSEMIRDEIIGPVTNQQRRAVSEIISSTARLSRMITELLDASRMESHSLSLRIDNFSPELLLRQLSDQISLPAEHKGLALTTELDPQLPAMLRGDPKRLLMILNNLAANAIKFTQQGSLHIRLFQPDADHWAFSVADTGQGIPANALEHIFEPFWQGNDPATRDTGGVGLGLSTVQQLVELMDGHIQVESTVGVGSIFRVTLPLDLSLQRGE